MFKAVVTFTTALVLAGACAAQPAGVTPEMIAMALPVEGAPLAEPGPYAVVSEPAFGSPGHVVFRPGDLATIDARGLPVVVWGNGGCAANSRFFVGFLSTVASHGFLVIATAARDGDPRGTATADDLRAAIDWAEAENARAGAPLSGHIATSQIAVMGSSCGGMLAIGLGADPRVDTIGVFNAGVLPATPEGAPSRFPGAQALANLHGPVLLINGHERDFMMAASLDTYVKLDNVPAFYGARHGAGHSATFGHPGGGEFANVATDWLRWMFRDDAQAAKSFVGDDCRLCTNPDWDVQAKRLQ